MCGIIGTIGGELNQRMIDSILHRGEHTYQYDDGHIHVKFHHLPILDQPNGIQPKQFGNWVLFFNGEIYNWKELNIQYDMNIEGHCDTLVILPLIDRFGVKDAVKKLNGMFAMFLYNTQTNEKYLIRDRYGIKPMYYTFIKDALYFSSELKSFKHHNSFKRELDYKALIEYLKYQNILSDRTLYKSVMLLPPATILHIHKGVYESYWKPEFKAPETMSFNDARDEVRRLMIRSVNRQLVSDRPVASFLSGGIDSNIIKIIAGNRIKDTYTAGFTEGRSEHLLTPDSNVMMFNSESIKLFLDDTFRYLDDLRSGPSYTNYALYQQVANDGYKVCLQGTGGDEIFGGYTHRYNMTQDYRSVLNRLKYYDDDLIDWDNDSLSKRMEFDMRHFLHGLLLVGDKLSMAHTIEDRVPFLDNDLVDFAMTIPNSMKVDKWILKSAFINDLPEAIINNSKWGFTSPEHLWFQTNQQWIKSELNHVWDIIEPTAVKDTPAMTWSLLSLEYWIKHNLL